MIAVPLLLALLAAHWAHADDVTIPVTNRPSNFSGAAGAYRIEVRAAPTTVHVEDPITVTVKIVSLEPGPWPHPPQRDKLRLLPPDVETNFFVEPLPELDRFLAGERAWEFTWRLMPKHQGVNKIPPLEFVYYHTAGTADFKAADGAKSIALDVKPRPALLLTAPASTRAQFQQVVEGEAFLTRSSSPLAGVAGGLALPPILCFAGYFVWWRLFPDAAERLRRRRGRALKTALKQLRKLGSSASPAQVHAVLADYLRLRLALPPGEPTPPEVKNALLLLGLRIDLANQAEEMLQSYDAVLFAPSSEVRADDLQSGATSLMRNLEVALCSLKSR